MAAYIQARRMLVNFTKNSCCATPLIRHSTDLSTYPLPECVSSLPVTTLDSHVEPVLSPNTSASSETNTEALQNSTFPVVALGGTFDHLHSGHKILLSMSAWIAHEKVIVGVTGKRQASRFINACRIISL